MMNQSYYERKIQRLKSFAIDCTGACWPSFHTRGFVRTGHRRIVAVNKEECHTAWLYLNSTLMIFFAFVVNVGGRSAKHQPQRCGKDHVLCDEDVVQLCKKVWMITYYSADFQQKCLLCQMDCVASGVTIRTLSSHSRMKLVREGLRLVNDLYFCQAHANVRWVRIAIDNGWGRWFLFWIALRRVIIIIMIVGTHCRGFRRCCCGGSGGDQIRLQFVP